jgi:hypothetical protein
MVEILTWVTPGLASLLVVATAWRTSPARGAGRREALTALLATIASFFTPRMHNLSAPTGPGRCARFCTIAAARATAR